MTAPKDKKNLPAGESGIRKLRRKKGKLIQLDDLIPKGKNVLGGRRHLFGASEINQITNKPKKI